MQKGVSETGFQLAKIPMITQSLYSIFLLLYPSPKRGDLITGGLMLLVLIPLFQQFRHGNFIKTNAE